MITVSFDELETLAGQALGATDWMPVEQGRIDTFAEATGDPQWIHVDPVRAKDGPFGTTIAHGYLTLALVVPLFSELLDVDGVTTKLNYGLNKVRFPSPVRVGSRIRLVATIDSVTPVGGGGKEIAWSAVIEIEGSDKPACVAQPVYRYYP